MRKQLGQMLIEAGAIDEATLRSALADQRRWGRPLGRTLVELRLINEEDLIRILGQQLGLPSIDLDRVTVPKAVLDMVPAKLVTQHGIMPFAIAGKFLDVAMADPTNLGIIDELRIRTQLNIRSYLAGPWMIERAIFKHYGGANPQIGARVGPSRAKTASQGRDRGCRRPRRALGGPAAHDDARPGQPQRGDRRAPGPDLAPRGAGGTRRGRAA